MLVHLLLIVTESFSANWFYSKCFLFKNCLFSSKKESQEMSSETKYELKYSPSVMVLNVLQIPLTWSSRCWRYFRVWIDDFVRESIYLFLYPPPSSFLVSIRMSLYSVGRCGINLNGITPPRREQVSWGNSRQRRTTVIYWMMQIIPTCLMSFCI